MQGKVNVFVSHCSAMAALDSLEEQSLRECENYIQTHSIQQILKNCIVQLCVRQPDNPISFLRQYFQRLERVSTNFIVLLHGETFTPSGHIRKVC